MQFAELYQEIRTYFSSCLIEYHQFTEQGSFTDKVKYLLRNEVVKKCLFKLEQAHKDKKVKFSDFSAEDNNCTSPCKEAEKDKTFLNPSSKELPQLTASAKLSISKTCGRKIVATKKILPGEVVIAERPYVSSLFPEFHLSHCLHCFKRCQPQEVIKCPQCLEVIFCSKICQEESRVYHARECGNLGFLQKDPDLGPMTMLVFRIMIKVGLEKCLETARLTQDEKAKLQRSARYNSSDYAPVFLQVDHIQDRDPGDTFRRILTSFFIIQFLRLAGYFPDSKSEQFFIESNEVLLDISCVIVHHLQSCSCNAYEVNELKIAMEGGNESLELGGAVYPTVSLTNHSCFPNTHRYSKGNTCVVRASRTINIGDEITDNYGVFYQMSSAKERQKRLKAQYFFDCKCKACKEMWPLVQDLRSQPARFKCQYCHQRVDEKAKKCAKCHKPVKVSKLIKEMGTIEDEVRKAMMGSGKISEEEKLAKLAKYNWILVEMEKCVVLPDWRFILCQQIMSHCHSLEGNISYL